MEHLSIIFLTKPEPTSSVRRILIWTCLLKKLVAHNKSLLQYSKGLLLVLDLGPAAICRVHRLHIATEQGANYYSSL